MPWTETPVCLLTVFGCMVYVLIPSQYNEKFDEKWKKVFFVSYISKGFQLFNPRMGDFSWNYIWGINNIRMKKQPYSINVPRYLRFNRQSPFNVIVYCFTGLRYTLVIFNKVGYEYFKVWCGLSWINPI